MTLKDILQRCCTLTRGSRDALYSDVPAKKIVTQLESAIEKLTLGKPLDMGALKMLFAPTGPLQETAIENGWGDEYLELSESFDSLIQ